MVSQKKKAVPADPTDSTHAVPTTSSVQGKVPSVASSCGDASCSHAHGPSEIEAESEDDDHNYESRLARRYPPPSKAPFIGVLIFIFAYAAAYSWLRLTDPRTWVRRGLVDRVSLPALALLFSAVLTSLYRVMHADPGAVPRSDPVWGTGSSSFRSSLVAKSGASLPLPVTEPVPSAAFAFHTTTERKANLGRRYCKHARVYKPDRAHYCHATARAVRRYDHHCIFVNAAVGQHNHKYFLLFLFYAAVTAALSAGDLFFRAGFLSGLGSPSAAVLGASARGGGSGSARLLITMAVFIIGAAVGIALAAFLGFHLYLIQQGCTTLEFGEKQGNVSHGSSRRYASPYGQSPALIAGAGLVRALALVPFAAPASAASPAGTFGAAGPGRGSGAPVLAAARASAGGLDCGLFLSRLEEVLGPRARWWLWFLPVPTQAAAAAAAGGETAGEADEWALCQWHPQVAAGQLPPRFSAPPAPRGFGGAGDEDDEDDEDDDDDGAAAAADEFGDALRRRQAERLGWTQHVSYDGHTGEADVAAETSSVDGSVASDSPDALG